MRLVLAAAVGLVGLLLTLPIVLCAVPFAIVGVLTSALARRLEPRAVPWEELVEFDAELGWRARRNLDCHGLATRDDRYHHVTDADGWTGRSDLSESAVVVFGDSFAFGVAIDAENHFANVSRVPMKSVGVPGYNMVQELLLMRRLAPGLRGKHIMWLAYCGNDLFDNLAPEMSGYRAPFVRSGAHGWEIVNGHLRPERWTCSRGRAERFHLPVMAALHSQTSMHRRALSACGFLIEQGQRTCAQADALLSVISIPSPMVLRTGGLALLGKHTETGAVIDPALPDLALSAICSRTGIPFLALREHLTASDYRNINDHWNEHGHRRVGSILAELYRDSLRLKA